MYSYDVVDFCEIFCGFFGRNCCGFFSHWPGCVVDKGILEESAEYEEDAHPTPNIDRLGVGHRGQRILDTRLYKEKNSENISFPNTDHNFLAGGSEFWILA